MHGLPKTCLLVSVQASAVWAGSGARQLATAMLAPDRLLTVLACRWPHVGLMAGAHHLPSCKSPGPLTGIHTSSCAPRATSPRPRFDAGDTSYLDSGCPEALAALLVRAGMMGVVAGPWWLRWWAWNRSKKDQGRQGEAGGNEGRMTWRPPTLPCTHLALAPDACASLTYACPSNPTA